MFSFFTVKAKNTKEKVLLEIDELEKVLKLSKKLTNKQIGRLAKYLRKHPPAERYNLNFADIQQALATDETIPSDFNVKSIQVEMRIAKFRAGEMVSREKSKKAGITLHTGYVILWNSTTIPQKIWRQGRETGECPNISADYLL